jgi:hypothetical protein
MYKDRKLVLAKGLVDKFELVHVGRNYWFLKNLAGLNILAHVCWYHLVQGLSSGRSAWGWCIPAEIPGIVIN